MHFIQVMGQLVKNELSKKSYYDRQHRHRAMVSLSHFSPSLKIGFTLALFYKSGNAIVSIEILNRYTKDLEIKGINILRKN